MNSSVPPCNCRKKENCPTPDRCRTPCVIYKASIAQAEYIGCTENEFKTRYNNHTHSFRADYKRSSTTLSQYIWDNNLQPASNTKWEILKTCTTIKPAQTSCDLCTSEKLFIIKNINNPRNINKRTDLGNKCIHRRKHMLDEITWNVPHKWGPTQSPLCQSLDSPLCEPSSELSSCQKYKSGQHTQHRPVPMTFSWKKRPSTGQCVCVIVLYIYI